LQDSENQAEQIFASVLGLEGYERAQYLDSACRNSPLLRKRVEELLAEDERAGEFLERPLMPELCAALGVQGRNGAASQGSGFGHGAGDTPQFAPGDVLIGRFMVVRYIARGGMGEVYEVEDLQLKGARVALKTIVSHYAADPMMHERFKREVLVARQISHPNVCPIYDLFQWDRAEGRLLFLTMKLLGGETLLARLERGPLPLSETAAIARQVGSGLAAAHAAGVLHRDIKAANIMLNGAGGGVYACITDFGLARAMVQDSTALTVHGVPGTPGYVAPELFYGEAPSAASDVFAFGVVVYQMLTGKLPRAAITDTQIRKELHDAAPAAWRRMVESCLQPTVGARCRDVDSALRMVPGLAMESSGRLTLRPAGGMHGRISRRRALALLGAGTAVTGMGAWVQWERIKFWFEPIPEKRFVALMAWPRGNLDAIVTTVLDSISQRLARAEAYVRDFLIITSKDLPPGIHPASAPEEGESTMGANLILVASMQQSPSSGHLDLRLLSAEGLRELRTSRIDYLPSAISTLAAKAAEQAAILLQLPRQEIPIGDPEELLSVPAEVYRAFSEAEQLMQRPNHQGLQEAILKYQQALELDPHFALGYAKLAISYIEEYVVTKDQANVELAGNNAASALRYNPASAMGLLSYALFHLYSGRTNEALNFFAKAIAANPNSPEVLLYQAQALEDKEKLDEAVMVYRTIIKDRPNYWPAYNNMGEVLERQAKYEEAAKAFAAAAVAAPKVSLPMANLADTYLQLGKREEARVALTESLKRGASADGYLALGDLDFQDRKYDSARRDYEQAAALEPTYHLIFRNIGDCYAMTGDAGKVRENYDKAARLLATKLAGDPQNGYDWATLAFYRAKLNDKQGTEAALKEVDKRKAIDVETRFMVTQALAVLGNREEALKMLLWCIDKGLSTVEVDLALDLGELRKDPRYVARIKRRSSETKSSS
jgi:tetratricopeptide (TPR) repeat protein/tRNA A-37 threonylcarbamoyl transferase component Bud32